MKQHAEPVDTAMAAAPGLTQQIGLEWDLDDVGNDGIAIERGKFDSKGG